MKKVLLILAVLILAAILFLGAGSASLAASGLNLAFIPADAAWVLHFDIERYTSSVAFKLLSDEEPTARMHRRVGRFFEKLRIDPLKDLRTITVFGRGEAREEPVVAISGNFDKSHLIGLLKTASSPREIPYGKHMIYSWEDEHFGVFAADDLIFVSQTEAAIRLALDALDGKIKNASSSPFIARLRKDFAGAFVLAAANNISGMVGPHQKPVILSKVRSAAFSAGEVGEVMNLRLDVAAESAPVAKDVEQAIRGLMAIANLQLPSADVQALTESTSIAVEGENVHIDVSYPIVKLVEFLKKHKALHHDFDIFDLPAPF